METLELTIPAKSRISVLNDHETPDIQTIPRADAPAIWTDARARFEKFKATAETLTIEDARTKDGKAIIRASRLSFKNLRCEVEKRRKELGEEALRRKQKIDSGAKEIVALIEPFESRLAELEQIEEREAAAARAQLATERGAMLVPLGVNAGPYNLGEMKEEDWTNLLAGFQAAHEAKIAAAARAEDERVAQEKADAAERERQRLETERLRREAAEREAAIKTEREEFERQRQEAETKARQEREAVEAAARKERERVAAERRAEAEKAAEELAAARAELQRQQDARDRAAAAERAKIEAEVRKEREAREKLEAEAKDAAKAEQDRINAAAAVSRKADAAPDKEKIAAFSWTVRSLVIPDLKSEDGKRIGDAIQVQVAKFASWLEKQAANL